MTGARYEPDLHVSADGYQPMVWQLDSLGLRDRIVWHGLTYHYHKQALAVAITKCKQLEIHNNER